MTVDRTGATSSNESRPPRAESAALRRRLLSVTLARLVVVSLLLFGTILLAADGGDGHFTVYTLSTLIAVVYAASAGFAIALSRATRLDRVAGLQVALDLIVITALVYVSGASTSVFSFLYGIVILVAALLVSPSALNLTAVSAMMLYVGLATGVAFGILPVPPDQSAIRFRVSGPELAFLMLIHTTGFGAVGLLAGNLSQRLLRTGGELLRAEAGREKLAALNAAIVQSLTAGILTTDERGRIESVNRAGLQIYRATNDDLVGRAIDEILPLDEIDAPNQGAGARGEGYARRVDGSEFPVGFTASALQQPSGLSNGSLYAFQDLTEIKELRRSAERAERLAALGRLSAGLAHEIRNPLSSISGSVELVRESPGVGEEDKRLLSIVVSEVDRLNDLVTTMLGVGRPKDPHPSTIDLGLLIEDVLAMASKADIGDVALAYSAPKERASAYADGDQIRQVLWNLIKNAIQASPPGGTIHLRALRSDDAFSVVEVRDEGAGIAEDDRERLFETFYSGRPHGVGLGLTLVKQIVQAHGGRIEIESEPGQGATFRLFLPREEARVARASTIDG